MRAVGEVLSLLSAQLSSSCISYRLTCHTHGRTFEDHAHIMLCPEKSVSGYHNEFEHVILNLINNARDAIQEKRERGPQAGPEQGMLTFEFTHEGGKIILEIGDNGGGIPDGILGRIFEPYFTTKDPAKGTGLGLYMSKVIIEDHMQGKLTARNSEQGAVIRIELPQATGDQPHD
jgi:signal transduction histidine kinase